MTAPHGARWLLPAVAVLAAAAAMLILASRSDPSTLDYGVGIVPAAVPWLSAGAVIVLAVVGLTPWVASGVGTVLVGVLVLTSGWSISALLFDALRAVRLVPLPLNGWGLGLRLLLLLGAAAALRPVFEARTSTRGRCPACHRLLPGALARVPRWPAAVASRSVG